MGRRTRRKMRIQLRIQMNLRIQMRAEKEDLKAEKGMQMITHLRGRRRGRMIRGKRNIMRWGGRTRRKMTWTKIAFGRIHLRIQMRSEKEHLKADRGNKM